MDFLIAPLIVAAIAGGLAALISAVDKVVNNYGDVKIDINNGKKELEIKGGEPLLSSLSAEGIYLPSACGGRGSCGACKCKIETDVGPILPTEFPYLSDEERANKTRLACQVKIKKDLSIMIPEELFNVKQFTGSVLSIKDITHDIKEVLVDIGDETIEFTSGMYIQLIVPPYGKIKDYNQRAYSISSRPSDKNKIEMLIRLVPGGIATTWVHNFLKEGDKIELVGPFGEFQKQETDAAMICIAGGSGMAPFKSILYDMFEKGETDREVWYFFGARTLKDLFYLEEMRELETKWKNFHFIPALSEPQKEDGWSGETGLITDILDKYLKEKTSHIENKEGYLCGSPGMINACIEVFDSNGISEDKIYYDKFA
jgi:Na+-transporting NADH:ubiquinone oxidoreductase subunit F